MQNKDRVVLIVRHGETDGNKSRTLQQPSEPLNKAGLHQARLCGARINREFPNIKRIVSSDMQRAVDTARCIAEATGIAEIKLDPLYQERNFGDLRGTSIDALIKEKVSVFDPNFKPPNGEDLDAFSERAARAWENLKQEVATIDQGEALVVVSHGLLIGRLVKHHIGLPQGSNMEGLVNTSITRVFVNGSEDGKDVSFHIDPNMLNSAKHLEGPDGEIGLEEPVNEKDDSSSSSSL